MNLSNTFKNHVDEVVTLTVRRRSGIYNQDITVTLRHIKNLEGDYWFIAESIDERGRNIELTQTEILQVKARARAGEDETGR